LKLNFVFGNKRAKTNSDVKAGMHACTGKHGSAAFSSAASNAKRGVIRRPTPVVSRRTRFGYSHLARSKVPIPANLRPLLVGAISFP